MFSEQEIAAINLEAYELTQKMKELPPGEVVIDTATFSQVYLKKQNEKIFHELQRLSLNLEEVLEIMGNSY